MADIELVIKIDEEDYKIMKHSIAMDNPLCPLSQEEMVSKVANGTPLLKGHGRLIDADKLYEQFGEVMDTVMREPKFTKDVEYILRTTATVKSQLKEADTIIEADKENK